MDNYEIVVVANHHRDPIILDYLVDIPHRVSYTPDYELPDGFAPLYTQFVHTDRQHLGHHRCIKGHQDALATSTADNILVFEDDAAPIDRSWVDLIPKIIPILNSGYDIISLHGRSIDFDDFKPTHEIAPGVNIYTPTLRKDFRIVMGTLCYMIHRQSIHKITDIEYIGMPIDVYIASRTAFGVVDPSPFLHDRSHGSLIDVES